MNETNAVGVQFIASPEDLEDKDYPFTEDHRERIALAKKLGFKLKLYVLSENGQSRLMAMAVVG